jgi:hypothetical protein
MNLERSVSQVCASRRRTASALKVLWKGPCHDEPQKAHVPEVARELEEHRELEQRQEPEVPVAEQRGR